MQRVEYAEPMAELHVQAAMLSHPGLVRDSNEDSVAYRIPGPRDPHARSGMLALVADGVGGHACGEVASQIAVQTFQLLYYEAGDTPVPAALAACFASANHLIHRRSQEDPACAGMGTTCTALVVRDNLAWLGHIGDSRAYLVRDSVARQISEDHSLTAEMVRNGAMSPEQAAASSERHIILRALGTQPRVEPLISDEGVPLRSGDVLVLCSDGLSDMVPDHVIATTAPAMPPLEACQALIDAALAAGGHDNVSVGIFAIGSMPVRSRPPRATREVRYAATAGGGQ